MDRKHILKNVENILAEKSDDELHQILESLTAPAPVQMSRTAPPKTGDEELSLDEIYAIAFDKAVELQMPLESVAFNADRNPVATFVFDYSGEKKEIAMAAKDVTKNRITAFFDRGKLTW